MQQVLWRDAMLVSVCDQKVAGSSGFWMLVWSFQGKHRRPTDEGRVRTSVAE